MYAAKRWCHGGRVLNASLAGSFYAYPERACCACGRATFASSPAERALSEVVLLATHSVDVTDARIWRHYGDDLRRSMPSAALWLLLFREVPWASTALTALTYGVDGVQLRVRIDDDWYDLSRWRKAHPAGTHWIDLYKDRDATEVMYGFHSDKAMEMMKRLPKAKTIPENVPPMSKETMNFRKWRADLVKDGWWEREWKHEAFNLGSWAVWLTAGIMLAQFQVSGSGCWV